jgi:hypothetical protein
LYRNALIFVVISVLVVTLIYSSYFISDVAGVTRGPITCQSDFPGYIKCCQTETDDEGLEIKWCTLCDNTNPPSNCSEREIATEGPQTPPPGPKGPLGTILPGGEVLQELQQIQPSPTPPVGGISEQPPLFGRNVGNVPLGGFFGQEPTIATTTDELSPEPTPVLSPPPSPPIATDVSPDLAPEEDVGPFPTPPTTPVPPVPPPTTPVPPPPPTPGFKGPPIATDVSPDLAPEEEDGQDDTDDGGIIPLPGNDLLPDTGITVEEPEVQQPEQEQEEPSNEDEDGGQDTAGPLT